MSRGLIVIEKQSMDAVRQTYMELRDEEEEVWCEALR